LALSAADYLSLVRIPLGVAFLLVAARTELAFAVLAAAGLSDVLDGWVARRQGPPPDPRHHRGDWLDPLCDKLFVAAVAAGLYLVHQVPVWLLLLLVTRELLQTIAVTIMRLVPALHARSRDYDFKAHPIGKATTVVQFATGAALLLGHALGRPLAILTAVMGIVSVTIYVGRLARTPEVKS
jgi:cardiolipin synthase (CMP-forming)